MGTDRGKILLVDDDGDFARVLGLELERIGFSVIQGYGRDVVRVAGDNDVDAVVLDIVMPGISGLDLLKTIKASYPDLDVVMLTGNATIDNAVKSMKDGASDYFTKPVELDRVEKILARCVENRRLREQNLRLKSRLSDLRGGSLIGGSTAMTELRALIRRFADSDSTVLIHGESGTGKELVANLIHENSPRRSEPFIVVDCTSLNETLLESELFGHERGAFTGAIAMKHGIFEVAHGGSVFLDEIGDLPHSLQAKLLRVVETKGFRRLGGNNRIDVDFRLIAATNRDLLDMVREGTFREDLYYRLNVINITIPPLREHRTDIVDLAAHFLDRPRKRAHTPRRFSARALELMVEYPWPGNVREVKNVVERAVILADGETIDAEHVPLRLSPVQAILTSHHGKELPSLSEMELRYIRWVLEKTGGNKKRAAEILKIDRKTLSRKLPHKESEES